MNRLCILGSASLILVACSEAPPDQAKTESGDLARTASALDFGGYSIEWRYLGSPWAANRIAAYRSGNKSTIYALNDDNNLYQGDGSDAGWRWVGHPWAAADIAASDDGVLYALNTDSAGHGLYGNTSGGSDGGWWFIDTPWGASWIAGGSALYAMNWDKTIYRNGGHSSWTSLNYAFANADDFERGDSWYGFSRWFAVIGSNLNFAVANGSAPAWTAAPLDAWGGQRMLIRDISAVSPTEVYLLTDRLPGFPRQLFSARFVETTCNDGQDNDRDNKTDGYDDHCVISLGNNLCSQYGSGSYCVARSGVSSPAVVKCSGGSLVSYNLPSSTTYGMPWCVQSASGDYIQYPSSSTYTPPTCTYGTLPDGQCAISPDA